MRRISDFQVRGKKILVRVDINCPVENGKISGSARIDAHSKTIKELSDRGAQVIVLSHQGRKDHKDFIGLGQHAVLLTDKIGRQVRFVADVVGDEARKAISELRDGEIILLDNVRFLFCETSHKEGLGRIVHDLSPIADYFVLDALSVAHRKHSSVIGFAKRIPCFAGDVLAAELDAISKVRNCDDVTFVFGGSKVEDSFAVMKKWLTEGRARHVLVGGALSVLFLHAAGRNVGDSASYLVESGLEGHVSEAKALLDEFDGKISLPVDAGISVDSKRHELEVESITKGQLLDIGEKTILQYIETINNSHCVVMNGPLGVYELEQFSKGTRSVLEAISRSNAFSLLGGGHTLAAIDMFGIDRKLFSYVSLSGKALVEYLCGKALPGLEALEYNEKTIQLNQDRAVSSKIQ